MKRLRPHLRARRLALGFAALGALVVVGCAWRGVAM